MGTKPLQKSPTEPAGPQRLQKLIAHAGIASRRRAEEMIERGQVTVDGEIAKLGDKADLSVNAVKVDGRRLDAKPSKPVYIALNKPKACISTTSDPEGRRTVMHLLPPRYRNKVYPVGRLDYHSEGLMLLTNDGEFANGVLSTKAEIPKTYLVKVKGVLSRDQLEKFRAGIRIEGRITAPAQIKLVRPGDNPWYEVVLNEGRNRQIRKMFMRFGLLVEKIRRTRIGPLSLNRLNLGSFRELTPREVEKFQRLWS